MQQHYESVKQFMEKAGQEIPSVPTVPSEDVRLLRARLIYEEAMETIGGLGVAIRWCLEDADENGCIEQRFEIDGEPDLTEIADGCCDMTVIATGTLHACGIDPAPIQAAVDESNLAKFTGDAHRDENGKWIKPAGWVAPDIAGLLEEQRKSSMSGIRWYVKLEGDDQ